MRKITKIIIKIFVSVILICASAFGLYYGWKKFQIVKTEKLHMMVSRTLVESAELTLYKLNYTDVVAIKKQAGFAKSYSIVKYSGVVRAGIRNIDEMTFSISPDRKTVSINIPPCELLGNDISSLKVFDETKNVFVSIRTQEIFDEIEVAKDETAQEILAEGLLDDADKRAKTYIKQLMLSMGFESVVID